MPDKTEMEKVPSRGPRHHLQVLSSQFSSRISFQFSCESPEKR
jgi:hypothetical protein